MIQSHRVDRLAASAAIAEAIEPRLLRSAPPVHVGLVAPDILGITVDDGQPIDGEIVLYEHQPGDQLPPEYDPWEHAGSRWIYRDGQKLGVLIGKNQDPGAGPIYMRTPDSGVSPWLNRGLLDNPSTYTFLPLDGGAVPAIENVWRKTTAVDFTSLMASGKRVAEMRHTVYLDFAAPLPVDKSYRIEFSEPNIDSIVFVNDPRGTRSEAIHVNQVGFHRDEVLKVAYLSCWMGNAPEGGGVDYGSGLTYRILNADGQTVYTGDVVLRKASDQKEDESTNGSLFDDGLFIYDDGTYNHSKVDVYEIDFSGYHPFHSGEYRVCVDGIGCSYPFLLSDDPWVEPFMMAMQGLYHHRSGIEIVVNDGTDGSWVRPRGFHPDKGDTVHEVSRTATMDLSSLHSYKTGRTVPEAWGGWMDAGDWDRRTRRLVNSYNLLDLYELYPGFFAGVDLLIPDSGDALPDPRYDNVDLPDILDEAMWGLDLYRRMQLPDGGIRGGIESSGHPRNGEVSWMESQEMYAFAPSPGDSYYYAAVAARAAFVLKRFDAELAVMYEHSAADALAWAEANGAGSDRTRAWAGAEMFRLTGDSQYHGIFLDATELQPRNTSQEIKGEELRALYAYAITEREGINASYQSHAREQLKHTVERYFLHAVDLSAWGVLKHAWAPWGYGRGTNPSGEAESVLRAYTLSGESEYLEGAVRGTGVSLGANPKNMVYTTGLGDNPTSTPLHVDSRNSSNPVPRGISIYGTVLPNENDPTAWPIVWDLIDDQALTPGFGSWPALENQHGHPGWVPMNEYTVHQTIAKNIYFWGYLAAMQSNRPPTLPPLVFDVTAAPESDAGPADRLVVTFSEDVSDTLSLADVFLQRDGAPVDLSGATLTWDHAALAATIDPPAPLPEGNYTLYLVSEGIGDYSGHPLDGDGDGIGGDLFVQSVQIGQPALPGDANRDGLVSDADYTLWADHYGASDATWEMGDFTGDAQVTDADYTLWADHYGAGAAAVSAPTFQLPAAGKALPGDYTLRDDAVGPMTEEPDDFDLLAMLSVPEAL